MNSKKVLVHILKRIAIFILLLAAVFVFWYLTTDEHKHCQGDEHRHYDTGLGLFIFLYFVAQLYFIYILFEMFYLFIKKRNYLAYGNLAIIAILLCIAAIFTKAIS